MWVGGGVCPCGQGAMRAGGGACAHVSEGGRVLMWAGVGGECAHVGKGLGEGGHVPTYVLRAP